MGADECEPVGADELACKPDSVPLRRAQRRRPSIWDTRRRMPHAAYPQARASSPRAPAQPHQPVGGCGLLALLRVGFTKPPRSPGMLVRSYRTVSPLPPFRRRAAVCFLWHCPASHLGLPLAITLLCEVRTFLDALPAARRGRPANSSAPINVLLGPKLPREWVGLHRLPVDQPAHLDRPTLHRYVEDVLSVDPVGVPTSGRPRLGGQMRLLVLVDRVVGDQIQR